MLGQIAEKLTGKPIARLMRERIFEPLGMTETSYPYTTALPKPYWNGYTNQNLVGTKIHDATHWSPTFFSSAGQIVSTLGDMKVYAKAVGDGSLIGKAAQRERLQPNPASVAAGREYDFAIGRDHGWITHSGEVPGYNTQFGYLPKLKATVVVLTNTDIENPGRRRCAGDDPRAGADPAQRPGQGDRSAKRPDSLTGTSALGSTAWPEARSSASH